jgi:hypothetical protein
VRTNGQADTTKRTVAFRNFAKSARNEDYSFKEWREREREREEKTVKEAVGAIN